MLGITFAAVFSDEDGRLLSSEPLTLTKPYAQLDDLSEFRFSKADYDAAKNQREFECLRIVYLSGGLRQAVERPTMLEDALLRPSARKTESNGLRSWAAIGLEIVTSASFGFGRRYR
jgi:hypothetical protein